jgi:hypothetical protein
MKNNTGKVNIVLQLHLCLTRSQGFAYFFLLGASYDGMGWTETPEFMNSLVGRSDLCYKNTSRGLSKLFVTCIALRTVA